MTSLGGVAMFFTLFVFGITCFLAGLAFEGSNRRERAWLLFCFAASVGSMTMVSLVGTLLGR
jgi:hypothetical protein